MKTLIIVKSLQYFWDKLREDFKGDGGAILKINRNQGRVELTDGTELIYVSSEKELHGYHGVDVQVWSIPDWWGPDTEDVIRQAKMNVSKLEVKK